MLRRITRTKAAGLLGSQGGLTLIELMVVLVILGLLAGLVYANFFPQVEKAERQAAETQMEIFSLALDNYRLDVGVYPDSLQGLIESSDEDWNGPYLRSKIIPNDPWRNPYQYEVVEDGADFRLSSAGGKKGPIESGG